MVVHKQRGAWESRTKVFILAILSLITLSPAGCTLFGNQAATTPSVTLSPASVSLPAGHTQQFTATVGGQANSGVAWSASGGSITSGGLYTAPNSAGSFVVTATSTAHDTVLASAAVTVTASVSVSISPASASLLTSGTQQFTATVSGTNNTAAIWSGTGGSVSSSGLYTAPSTAGTFTVKATSVADHTKSASATVTVSATTLSITTSSLNNEIVGTPYQATLAAAGGTAPYSWRVSAGQLPPGLALATNGALAGTPTSAGQFSVTVQVADSGSPQQTAFQSFSMSITAAPPPLTISTSSLASGNVGTAYSAILVASGGTPAYTWSISSGQLPAGLTLGAMSGQISGTPSAAGSSSFTIRLTDSGSPAQSTSKLLSISVAPTILPLSITTRSLPSVTVGTPYSATLSASGGIPPYEWSVSSGVLPAGLTLSPAGVISGTPTAEGTVSFTVRVTDSEP